MTRELRSGIVAPLMALVAPMLAAASLASNTDASIAEALSAMLPFVLVAACGAVCLHMFARRADLGLYAIAVALMGLGLVLVGRTRPDLFDKQRAWTVVSIILCCLVALAMRRPQRLAAYTYVCGAAAAGLLALTAVVGSEINGAKLWIQIGGLSVQPSEFTKLLMCVFLAAYLGAKREALADWRDRFLGIPYPSARNLGPLVLMWAASMVLVVLQRDLGCALVLFCVFLAMLHVATGRSIFVILGLTMFALAAWAIAPSFPHVATRVTAWLDPWPYIDDITGHQIVRGLFALASGGVVGTGLGRGLPESIPVVESDFIYAALGEELGLVGGAAVCLAFAILVARAAHHSAKSRDDFCALLCAGLAAGLGVQAVIIIAGVTKAIPMTGITLPFVSYGGSSLAASGLALGMLLSLSARANANDDLGVGEVAKGPVPHVIVKAHVLALAVLSAWPAYWQVLRADELSFHPKNPRLLAIERSIERGRILDRNGKTLAENGEEPGSRVYSHGALISHIVGYRDDIYGLAGIEGSRSGWLLGLTSPKGSILDVVRLPKRRTRGYDTRLTLDLDLQQAAWNRLGNVRGAVVALDPRSGDILALVSRPSFDPTDLTSAMAGSSGEAGLLARATQGLYPPGSVFKILVASAALNSGAVTKDFEATCEGETIIAHDRIVCHNRSGHGTIRMEQAVSGSCNIYFAQVGRRLGPGRFEEYARRFGIGETPALDIPVTPSSVPMGAALNEAMLMESSFGQGAVQVTPLQMALITATIANGGERVEPRLVDAALDEGREITREPEGRRQRILSQDAARQVGAFMQTTARSGTGASGAVPGIATAAKTGSAENPHGRTHAWFVAYAPADNPQVVVTVVVENGGGGGAVAGPIARDVMAAWLKR